MSYGAQVFDAYGRTLLDSSLSASCFIDLLDLPTGAASGSRSYPDLAGVNLRYNQFYRNTVGSKDARMHSIRLDTDSSGAPRITWTLVSPSVGTFVFVFAV